VVREQGDFLDEFMNEHATLLEGRCTPDSLDVEIPLAA
jgi:hypothetical protein